MSSTPPSVLLPPPVEPGSLIPPSPTLFASTDHIQGIPHQLELQAVLSSLTDGVQLFDSHGSLVSRNRAAADIFEVDNSQPTEALLVKWELLRQDGSPLPDEDRPLMVSLRTGQASGRVVVGMRNTLDGRVRWLSVSTVPVRQEDETISGFVSCSHDLTEQMDTIRGLIIINQAASQLSASLVPEDVYRALTMAASDLASAPGERPRRASLLLVKKEGLEVGSLTDPTHPGVYSDPIIPLADNPFTSRVIATGKTLVTEFTPSDFGPFSAPVIDKAAIKHAAMIPLFADGSIFAILSVASRDLASVSPQLLTRLQTLAAMGSLAIVNARDHQSMLSGHQALEMVLRQEKLDASENERKRIADDLHDGVVQDLVGMEYMLNVNAKIYKGKIEPELVELLLNSAETTRIATQNLRTLIIELAPPALWFEGLKQALLGLKSELDAQGTKVELTVAGDLSLTKEQEEIFFRVAKEAFTNIQKHAEADTMAVAITTQGNEAKLSIRDNGKGFSIIEAEVKRQEGHRGVVSMSERLEAAGGRFEINSEIGKGTEVSLRLPVAHAEKR